MEGGSGGSTGKRRRSKEEEESKMEGGSPAKRRRSKEEEEESSSKAAVEVEDGTEKSEDEAEGEDEAEKGEHEAEKVFEVGDELEVKTEAVEAEEEDAEKVETEDEEAEEVETEEDEAEEVIPRGAQFGDVGIVVNTPVDREVYATIEDDGYVSMTSERVNSLLDNDVLRPFYVLEEGSGTWFSVRFECRLNLNSNRRDKSVSYQLLGDADWNQWVNNLQVLPESSIVFKVRGNMISFEFL